MNAHDYILSKQIQWAYRNNIRLIGSKGNGRKSYTQKLDDNLFEPLLPETESNFTQADGEELTGPLIGIRSYHFKIGKVQYRIAYTINENEHMIKILMIAKRESFYHLLKRRLK